MDSTVTPGETRCEAVVQPAGISPAQHEHALVGLVSDRFLRGFASHRFLRPAVTILASASRLASASEVEKTGGIGPVHPTAVGSRGGGRPGGRFTHQ